MPRQSRSGYTILELLVVLALLVILGAVIIPSLPGFYGNTKQKAAADVVRTRLAEARAKSMERGMPFRVAVNSDKTRIRVAPDTEDFASLPADDPPAFDSTVTEDLFEEISIDYMTEPGDDRSADPSGWFTIATMRPDGSCKESRSIVVSVNESTYAPIMIQVRGLTGQIRSVVGTKDGSVK